jgi:MFS transporter, FLVCR family, feline leukemia virus subgroup C receptor-related protein
MRFPVIKTPLLLLFFFFGLKSLLIQTCCFFTRFCSLFRPQIVLVHYPGHEMDAGRIGLCIVLAGMLGSVACGIVLDKTHRFK